MFRSKRVRIIVANLILAVLLASLNFLNERMSYPFIFFLTLISYLITYWSFGQYLYGIKLVTLFVLPVTLTATTGIFLVQTETNTWQKVLVIVLFLVLNYIINLAENIFNVSEVRSIPLLRAAHTVGYLSTLGVGYLSFLLLYNSHLNIALITLILVVFTLMLFLQAFWQIELKDGISRELILSSFAASLMTSQLGFILGFWPLSPLSTALALTTAVYTILGLIQHQIAKNITRRAILEYLFVGLSVFTLLLVTMQ